MIQPKTRYTTVGSNRIAFQKPLGTLGATQTQVADAEARIESAIAALES